MTRRSPPPVSRPAGRDALRVAVLLWGLVAAIFVVALRNAPVDATGVAVFMAYEGEARRQFLEDAATEVLAAALDGIGPVRSVPPRALTGAREAAASAGEPAGGAPSVDEARALAQASGASHFVLGSITLEGREVTLSATLHETEGTRSRLVTATGDLAQLAPLLDEVSSGLASRFFGTGGARPRATRDLFTASLPALEAFFRAERAFAAERYRQAGSLYERALREDPDFALAHHRLASTAELLDRHELARQASAAAARLGAGLSPRHRLLVQARDAWIHGSPDEAERILSTLVEAYPLDPDAWARLGELQFHGAAFRAQPATVALQATGRALRLDPANAEALEHLAHIAVTAGDRRRLAELAEQAEESLPDAPWLTLALRAVGEAMDAGITDATLERLAVDDGTAARTATRMLAASAATVQAALGTAALLAAEDRPEGARALGEVWTAFLHLARGRRAPAEEAFRRAADLDPDLAVEHRGLAHTLPFLAYDAAGTERLARELEQWRPGGALTHAEPEPHYQMHLQSRPAFAPYLAGRLSLAAGDTAAARLWVVETRAAPWSPDDPPLPPAFAAGLDAEIARVGGEEPDAPSGAHGGAGTTPAANALDALLSAYHDTSFRLRQPSMILSLARERWLIAELLEELGRTDEAVRWFEPYWGRVGEAVFLAPSHYRRGLLREAAGDLAGAAADLRRFLELWSDADPALAGWVDDARARLAALPGG